MTENETDLFDLDAEEKVTEPDAPKVDEKELEELRAYRETTQAEKRQQAIASAFEEAGLPSKASRLFDALNPDSEPTADAIKAFSEEYGINPDPPKPTGFTPTVVQGSRTPAAKKYTRQEMEEIARDNPARARALAEAGRVQWSNAAINAQPQR
jgi:hypothetical protein